jgi:hypothetical protein
VVLDIRTIDIGDVSQDRNEVLVLLWRQTYYKSIRIVGDLDNIIGRRQKGVRFAFFSDNSTIVS